MADVASTSKTLLDIKSGPLWQWALIGGSIGYFIFHPRIMIVAHLMFQPRFKSQVSVIDLVFAESARAFSLEMLPWGYPSLSSAGLLNLNLFLNEKFMF